MNALVSNQRVEGPIVDTAINRDGTLFAIARQYGNQPTIVYAISAAEVC